MKNLFKRAADGSSIKFHCVGLSNDTLEFITRIVTENGGEMGSDELPIIFQEKSDYTDEQHEPMLRVYDIDFIKICARKEKLINLQKYRLSPKKLAEDSITSAFLYGVECRCAMEFPESLVTTHLGLSSESDVPPSQDIVLQRIKQSQSMEEANVESQPARLSQRLGEMRFVESCHFMMPINDRQSSESCSMQNPPSSQDTYYSAIYERKIKSEPIDGEGCERIPLSSDNQEPPIRDVASRTVADFETSDKSPGVNDQKSPSPEKSSSPELVTRPRLKVLNLSKLMGKSVEDESNNLVNKKVDNQQPGPSGCQSRCSCETGRKRRNNFNHPARNADCEPREPMSTRMNIDGKRNAETSLTDVWSDDNEESDETSEPAHRSRQRKPRTRIKKNDPLDYAKEWRYQLESARVIKEEVTNSRFTKAEQKMMVDFLCSHRNIERLHPKGYKIWYDFLNKGWLPYRTAQSLQNHFTKYLLPRIQHFFSGMSDDHRRQFLHLQNISH